MGAAAEPQMLLKIDRVHSLMPAATWHNNTLRPLFEPSSYKTLRGSTKGFLFCGGSVYQWNFRLINGIIRFINGITLLTNGITRLTNGWGPWLEARTGVPSHQLAE